MSDELDRRAALAMGWKETDMRPVWRDKFGNSHWVGGVEGWSPSTDRNDLSELLREVGRRDLKIRDNLRKKIYELYFEDDEILAYTDVYYSIMADPAVICEAACEVLEAK